MSVYSFAIAAQKLPKQTPKTITSRFTITPKPLSFTTMLLDRSHLNQLAKAASRK